MDRHRGRRRRSAGHRRFRRRPVPDVVAAPRRARRGVRSRVQNRRRYPRDRASHRRHCDRGGRQVTRARGLIGQRALVILALVAGAFAGTLYYVGAQRSPVVVAARDVDATHPLVADDLAIVSMPADAVPAGALADGNVAIGKLPKAPLWRGQILLDAALSEDAASFHTGLALPLGMRAVALPVSSAAQAMGGAIVPGARVDVLAVPVAGGAPRGAATRRPFPGALG